MFVVYLAGAPARFKKSDRWLWVPAFAGTTTLSFPGSPNDPSVGARADPAGQDRLPDGGQRQGDHLSRARRIVEPKRASVSCAWPETRRSHRIPDRKPAGVYGDLLGGAAQRALLHRD